MLHHLVRISRHNIPDHLDNSLLQKFSISILFLDNECYEAQCFIFQQNRCIQKEMANGIGKIELHRQSSYWNEVCQTIKEYQPPYKITRDDVTNTIKSIRLKALQQECESPSSRKSYFTKSLKEAWMTKNASRRITTSTGGWRKDM